MDEKNENNDVGIEFENEVLERKTLSIQEQVYEIEIRMQEIDVQIELFEEAYYQSEDDFDYEEIEKLKEEYKELRKKKKEILKRNKGKWDSIPVSLFVYGIFQIIFSSFFVLFIVSSLFSGWFITTFFTSTPGNFWLYFSLLFIPIISVLISTVILIFIKDKMRKKFFLIIYIIQFIETLITVIFMVGLI